MTIRKIIGGLDPSLSNFGMSKGVAVYSTSGIQSFNPIDIKLVTTSSDPNIEYKNLDDLHRAKKLSVELRNFFQDCDAVYAELPIGSQSSRAMASYGISLGVIGSSGLIIKRVSPKDVKVFATGNPKASKKDMIDWATGMYPDLPWLTTKRKGIVSYTNSNEHIADSLAAIHAGLQI